MSPWADGEYVAHLASELGYPLVVVAANRLGVINQTLQTLCTAAAFQGGLPVAGVVLNEITPASDDVSRQSNYGELVAHWSRRGLRLLK